jgi:predicted MFS family arabinose efflux permease
VSIAAVAGPLFLAEWGWRVAFLLGALILPFGYLMRRSLPETLHREEPRLVVHPERPHLRAHMRILVQGLALIGSATVCTYVFAYMTTYAITTLKMPPGAAFGASVASGVSGVIGGLIGGVLSDRFGRKPMMIWPRIGFLLVTWPAFQLMVSNHDATALLGATFVMQILSSLSTAAVLVGLTESLDKSVRGLGMGVVYAIAVSVFGGTTQPIIATLTHVTGDPLSPAWYMMGATAIGLVASLVYKESAHRKAAAL